MKIAYFRETDTLYVELRQAPVVETQDVDQNTQIDLDEHGNVCSLTLEHVRTWLA